MPGRPSLAESTVLQVLQIHTFTHSGFYPAVPERSLSTAVSVEYWNGSLPVVKMGDFEFNIELLISRWKPGPCCETGRMIFVKTKTKRKRHGEKFVFVFKKTSKL